MNTNEAQNFFEIVDGPNKDMLFDACKYAYGNIHIPINFTIQAGKIMPISDVRIISIEHEDGSGESFNLRGYCGTSSRQRADSIMLQERYKFKACYNAKRRSGRIAFFE